MASVVVLDKRTVADPTVPDRSQAAATLTSHCSSCSRGELASAEQHNAAVFPFKQLSRVCFRLLEENLRYIHSVAARVEENTDKPTAKFWRVLLNKAYDVLDKVHISVLC